MSVGFSSSALVSSSPRFDLPLYRICNFYDDVEQHLFFHSSKILISEPMSNDYYLDYQRALC